MERGLLKILVCPFCKSKLLYKKNLICNKCKRVYKIEEGIPDFVDFSFIK